MPWPEKSAQPVTLPARHDVHVKMRHALTHAIVDGDEDAVRVERDLDGARDPLRRTEHRRDLVGREIGKRRPVLARDHQDVARKEGTGVEKGDARPIGQDPVRAGRARCNRTKTHT